MSESTFSNYLHGFQEAKSQEETLRKLRELGTLRFEDKEFVTEQFKTLTYGFNLLSNLLIQKGDFESLGNLLTSDMLSLYFEFEKAGAVSLHDFRESVIKTIDQLPENIRADIIDKYLDRAMSILDQRDSSLALNMIAALGYGSKELLEFVWKIAMRNPNEFGDSALSTLTWLPLPSEWSDRVIGEIHNRLSFRFNSYLVWPLARIGDQESVDILLAYLMDQSKTELSDWDGMMIAPVLKDLLIKFEDSSALQDETWQKLTIYNREVQENDTAPIDLRTIATGCNSPLVVPTLLNLLLSLEANKSENKADVGIYIMSLRLEECVMPRQLVGWATPVKKDVISLLLREATKDTGQDLFATTSEDLVKSGSIDMLLLIGNQEIIELFEEVVQNETSRFLQARIMDRLACFKLDSLPSKVVEWVEEEFDQDNSSDGRELARRFAATRLVRSAASPSALEVLLKFGIVNRGKAMLQSSNAIAEVGLNLLKQEKFDSIERLILSTKRDNLEHYRVAAVAALEQIALRYPERIAKYQNDLIDIAFDEQRETYERGTALYALGHIEGNLIFGDIKAEFEKWGNREDRWLGGGSVYCLAKQGLLVENATLMNKIGLSRYGEEWHLTNDVKVEWGAFILGVLYSKNPSQFLPALISLISSRGWQDLKQVIQWIDYTHVENEIEPAKSLIDALIERVIEKTSASRSEPELIGLIARIAPTKFINFDWTEHISNWMPDARVSLANAYGHSASLVSYEKFDYRTLFILAADSVYAVRRAAFRAIGSINQEQLFELCSSWLEENAPFQFSIYAIEAAGWLKDDIENGKGNKRIIDKGKVHQEREVRKAIDRSEEERRARQWSKTYIKKIHSATRADNVEISKLWCYGDALSRTGDDEILRQLEGILKDPSHSPNFRFWIQKIMSNLEQNWKKHTQKWPEPWVDLSGMILNGEGILVSRNNEYQVSYSIWLQPATAPNKTHSWGGVVVANTFSGFLGTDTADLFLENGGKQEIRFSGFTGNTATFLGIGLLNNS